MACYNAESDDGDGSNDGHAELRHCNRRPDDFQVSVTTVIKSNYVCWQFS